MPKVYMARLLRLIQHANLRLPSSNTTGSIHSSPSAPISTLDWVSSCANNLKSKRASRFYITGIMVFWNYPSILVKFSQDQAKILLELHTNPSHRKYSTISIKVWQVLRLVSNSNVLYVMFTVRFGRSPSSLLTNSVSGKIKMVKTNSRSR